MISEATDIFGQFCEIILFKVSDMQINVGISIEHENCDIFKHYNSV